MTKSTYRQTLSTANRQGGSVSIIIAFMLLVIIGFAGLAIDGGRSYGVKAQLSAASDAAAIAGVEALKVGVTQAERIANAQVAAQRYFSLNYPLNYQQSTAFTPVTSVTPQADGSWEVTVTANATVPNVFMKALGFSSNRIHSVAQTVREGIDIVMVLDSSGSIGGDMPVLKDAAKNGFVANFIPGAGGDRLGVVSFSSGSVINEAINRTGQRGFDLNRVNTAIDSLSPKFRTATSEAMRKALGELRAIPSGIQSGLRVMLVFSDGAPNVFGVDIGGVRTNVLGQTTFRNPDTLDSSGTPVTLNTLPTLATGGIPLAGRRTFSGDMYCDINRAARNTMEKVAEIARTEGIIVYSIGMGSQLNGVEWSGCGYGSDEHGSAIMRRVANTPDQNPDFIANQPKGLYCFAADSTRLKECFRQISNDILRLTM